MNQREAFEKWAKSEFTNHSEMYFEWCEEYRHYVIDEVDFAWQAWQAATAIEREECAKECESMTPSFMSCDIGGNPIDGYVQQWRVAEKIRNRANELKTNERQFYAGTNAIGGHSGHGGGLD